VIEHGGRLLEAAKRYSTPVSDWLDLSTGINPNGWKVPDIPSHVWNRLPENDDGLILAAASYFGSDNLLAVAGSQAAIQVLPQVRNNLYKKSRVGVLFPAYAEHAHSWQQAEHEVISVEENEIDSQIDQIDVLVLVNPNNPSGCRFEKDTLRRWHSQLRRRDGWLVVDEAFIDSTPARSLVSETNQPGLIVLRSLGKFFGLAGLRVGFVFSETSLLKMIDEILGPWTISHPSRFVATQALQDIAWQLTTQSKLQKTSERLRELLCAYDLVPIGGTHLFHWTKHDKAFDWHKALAGQGILVRYFENTNSLRFGLPKDNAQFERLNDGLMRAQKKVRGLYVN